MFCASPAGRADNAPIHPVRDDVIDQIAVDWLPDDVKHGLQTEDPTRFENVVLAVEQRPERRSTRIVLDWSMQRSS